MILQPVLHPLLIALLTLPLATVAVWALVTVRGAGRRVLWALRILLVICCALLLLRPGLPGGETKTLSTRTDIVLLVDTTASIVAEDWADGEPRLAGVREDIATLVEEYPGARFALIGFDATAELRLPLTTDADALLSALQVMQPEVTAQSRGSSIGIAAQLLEETLRGAAELSPERARMVFYFGDGEQTAETSPESFSSSAELISGGAVFGYGTEDGGRMRLTTGRPGDEPRYIEYEGQPALSVIDEEALATIAADLGVDYHHRTADAPAPLPPPPASADYAASGTTGDVIELYWMIALVIAALLAIELARASMMIVRTRMLTRPRRARADAAGGER